MAKVQALNADEWKKYLITRWEAARKYRELFEAQVQTNYLTIHTTAVRTADLFSTSFTESVELESGEVDAGDSQIGMNYAFKYLRFFHAQLSANPPSVVVRPTSFDPTDRRKADAADRLVRYGMRDQALPEVVDQASHNMLWAGTGWVKQVWDPDRGDVYDFNEETREVTMKGDINSYAPAWDDVWIDPTARRWADVRFIFERHYMPYEDAAFLFPQFKDQLKKAIVPKSALDSTVLEHNSSTETDNVAIYEYYEKGLPINGTAGRHAWFLDDGTLLREPGKNPHIHAGLPYHCFTYLDVPNQVYGKSVVEYVARLQDMLNRLDSSVLDSIQAHGVVRLLLPQDTEIEEHAISNSSWDWVKYSGTQPPQFLQPTGMPGDVWRFREQLLVAIQELYGINDSMLGIQRREQSAVSQQTAIEAGTMIHRRLFKKYAMFVEGIYRDFLGLIRENWEETRTVLVLGKEKAFEAADFKGADIAGGFDLVVEYGTSLPIDPNMRREAIMLLMEPLKEAGMSMKQILGLMKLNDLEGMHDRMEMAAERQREVFEEMIAQYYAGTPVYIAPKPKQEHQGMLDYAYDYIMTSEFNNQLPLDLQNLLFRHIEEREQIEAAQQAPPPATGDAAPAGLPGVSGAVTPSVGGRAPGAPPLTALLGGQQ